MQAQSDRAERTAAPYGDALSASLEDYLEAILLLERSSRVARVSEIAEQLKVSRPSVTSALKNLGSRGLVLHARYGHVTLTTEGARIALGVERRHIAIRDFLTGILSIPEDLAEVSACRLEHVLEPEVLAHFVAYAETHGVTGTSRCPALRELAVGADA
jgi:DtxR family transcriptional regulator, Mn-dependent transcriptional regulator